VSPFDPKSVLLAKHAQHVVLIHFPIGLFLMGVAFDFVAQRTRNKMLAAAAYYNLVAAAVLVLPTVLTGLIAWRWALEGSPLKGILLWHLLFAIVTTLLMAIVGRVHLRSWRRKTDLPGWRLPVELLTCLVVGLTAHLGGFLSGVNG
jgi:uncharacterized membrane protein